MKDGFTRVRIHIMSEDMRQVQESRNIVAGMKPSTYENLLRASGFVHDSKHNTMRQEISWEAKTAYFAWVGEDGIAVHGSYQNGGPEPYYVHGFGFLAICIAGSLMEACSDAGWLSVATRECTTVYSADL